MCVREKEGGRCTCVCVRECVCVSVCVRACVRCARVCALRNWVSACASVYKIVQRAFCVMCMRAGAYVALSASVLSALYRPSCHHPAQAHKGTYTDAYTQHTYSLNFTHTLSIPRTHTQTHTYTTIHTCTPYAHSAAPPPLSDLGTPPAPIVPV